MTLGSAGNTVGPALHILEVIKQYTVMYICGDDYDDEEPVLSQWVAVKEEKSFFAERKKFFCRKPGSTAWISVYL